MLGVVVGAAASASTLAPLSRRTVMTSGAAATAASAMSPHTVAQATVDHGSQLESRANAIAKLLGRVPAYVVVNSNGEPYLTEMDGDGRRSGLVWLGPRDAAPILAEVQRYDPAASLAVLPLAKVYGDIARTAVDAAAARARVQQPRRSTSTDMSLFELRGLGDERSEAVSMLPGASLAPGVPLYYEPSLFLGTNEAGQRVRPYFFRLEDLNTVWRQGEGDDRNEGRISPSLRVLTLEGLLRQVADGAVEVPPLLMPPSETAALEYR